MNDLNLKILVVTVIVLGSSLTLVAGLALAITSLPSSPGYPAGDRVLRIRAVDQNGKWGLPLYTANDVLNWIADLQPTTLNRFSDGVPSGAASVPVAVGQPVMTTTQFVQNVLTAMGKYTTTAQIFGRLSLKDYLPAAGCTGCTGSNATFMSEAQQIYAFYSSLNPPQKLLSLDNTLPFASYYGVNAPAQAAAIQTNLYNIGFTGVEWGACTSQNLPGIQSDTSFFTMECSAPCTTVSNCTINLTALATDKSLPSTKEIESQIDFPAEMSALELLPVDSQAQIFTNQASNQTKWGTHYMYPIAQVGTQSWYALQQLTSATGPWHGQSLYAVMKSLLNTYNPLTTTTGLSVSFSSSASGGLPGTNIIFYPSVSGGVAPYTYTWSFGDSTSSTNSTTVNHTFATAGSYTASLTVKDSSTLSSTASQTITIVNPPLTISFTYSPSIVTAGTMMTFTGTASGGVRPYTYTFFFGDGSSASPGVSGVNIITHSYSVAGTYSAYVQIKDSSVPQGTATSGTQTITVNPTTPPPLSSSFTISPASSGTIYTAQAVTFVASATGGLGPFSFAWNFGDGTTNTGNQTVVHTYALGGIYNINLNVTDSEVPPKTANIIQYLTITQSATVGGTVTSIGVPIILIIGVSITAIGIAVPTVYLMSKRKPE